MDWRMFFLVFMATGPLWSHGKVYLYPVHGKSQKGLGKLLRRFSTYDMPMIKKPSSVWELPAAEPIHPGHTLLRPSMNSLQSAIKFPQRTGSGKLVYGNYDNLGITFGKTNQRIRYSDFRKHNMLNNILDHVNKIKRNEMSSDPPVIILGPYTVPSGKLKNHLNIEDNPREIRDDSFGEESNEEFELRRSRKKSKFRKRDNLLRTNPDGTNATCAPEETEEEESEEESDLDKNPGNPYTVSRSKYKQNWLWNFDMDGNHMNVNPFGPEFDSLSPTGADLFYGRKWWYFNQDDYIPLG